MSTTSRDQAEAIALADLEALAHRALALERLLPGGRFGFFRLPAEDVPRMASKFDRRLREAAFADTHLDLLAVDVVRQRRVGNTSIFVLQRRHFEALRFWRRTPGEPWALEKTRLGDVMGAGGASTVVMHGYTEGPLFVDPGPEAARSGGFTVPYCRFLIELAGLCRRRGIPLLVETTGEVELPQALADRGRLTPADLDAGQRGSIGRTRAQSAATERLATLVGLEVVPDLYNERTLGKVFCSVPGAQRGRWVS